LIQLIKENRIFFSLLVVLYIIGAVFLVYVPKNEIHLWFNSFHNEFCDMFFQYYTEVGNGVTIFVIASIVFFFDKKLAYTIGLAALAAGLTVQLMKHLVFPDIMRPSAVMDNLYLVKGVVMNKRFSFPSGHTATAFAMFSVLVFYFSKKRIKLLFLLFALLVAYSRIYLSQHFLIDTYFGSFIGVAFAILFYYLIIIKTGKDDEEVA